MALTLACSGMDAGSEKELRTTFAQANGRLDGAWSLLPESDADHIVVDMDSIYGPMSWIRLHAAGKYVIGLTSAPRTRTNFHLERPITIDGLVRLLGDIARAQGVAVADSEQATVPPAGAATPALEDVAPTQVVPVTAQVVAETSPAAAVPDQAAGDVAPASQDVGEAAPVCVTESAPIDLPMAPPHGQTPAPAPMDQLPKEQPLVPDARDAPPEAVVPGAVVPAAALQPADTAQAREAATTAAPEPATAAPDADAKASTAPPLPASEPSDAIATGQALAYWLAPGRLSGRTRLRSSRAPTLYFDAATGDYFGPATLKPLAGAFEGKVRVDEFEPVDAAAWTRETAALGAPQPLSRLHWYAMLLAGKGKLLPGNDANGHYRLLRWPQTEREFPRHFRIATTMMKAAASLAEISQASSVPLEDVADFVNASLSTGHAQYVWPTRSEPSGDAGKGGGLFGRLLGGR